MPAKSICYRYNMDSKNRAPDNSIDFFSSMKRLLVSKEKETENRRKINNARQLRISNLQKEIKTRRLFMK